MTNVLRDVYVIILYYKTGCPAFEKQVKSGKWSRNFFDMGNVQECKVSFTQAGILGVYYMDIVYSATLKDLNYS